jgi:glucan phosphoethanolaminetransferase (alkaline phosphatase superfamily)
MTLKKTINKFSEISLIAILSIFTLVIFNSKNFNLLNFFLVNIINFNSILSIIFIYIIIFSFFIIISFNKLLFITINILIFTLSTIYIYTLNKFGTILDENIITNALLSIGHVNEIIDISLIYYFIFLLIIPIILILKFNLTKSLRKIKILFLNIIVLLIIFLITPNYSLKSSFEKFSPINYLKSLYIYFDRFYYLNDIIKSRRDLTQFYNFSYQEKIANLNVFIVLGESLRSDHMQLFGYHRPTTPFLNKLEQESRIIKFNLQANFNLTNQAVGALLSHRTAKEFIDISPEQSIISVFSKFGFTTNWFSSQSSKEFGNGILNILGTESDRAFYRDYLRRDYDNNIVYDISLLTHIEQAIKNQSKKNFFVIHTFGSHIRYNDRYPQNFQKFLPICDKNLSLCTNEEIINSYDNSILYTDYFLNEFFKIIDNTNSIVFYVADHGQYLGEGGVFGNGNHIAKETNIHKVPMLIYLSKNLTKNVDFAKEIKKAKIYQGRADLSQDIFFDTVLGCLGFKSEILNRGLNLCR